VDDRIIVGVAALLGALVGGLATYFATVEAQKGENNRVEKRIEQEARGAARALIYELRDSTAEFDEILKEGHYRPLDSRFPVHLAQADMELIISRLSQEQYDDLSRALSGIDTLYRYLRFQHPGRTKGFAAILNPYERKSIRHYATEGVKAMNGLAGVADLTNPGKYFSPPPEKRS
jgi:hypothetical protein